MDEMDIFNVDDHVVQDIDYYQITTQSLDESLLVEQETQNSDQKYQAKI